MTKLTLVIAAALCLLGVAMMQRVERVDWARMHAAAPRSDVQAAAPEATPFGSGAAVRNLLF